MYLRSESVDWFCRMRIPRTAQLLSGHRFVAKFSVVPVEVRYAYNITILQFHNTVLFTAGVQVSIQLTCRCVCFHSLALPSEDRYWIQCFAIAASDLTLSPKYHVPVHFVTLWGSEYVKGSQYLS